MYSSSLAKGTDSDNVRHSGPDTSVFTRKRCSFQMEKRKNKCNISHIHIQGLQMQLWDKEPLLQPNRSLFWESEVISLFSRAGRFFGSIGVLSRWVYHHFLNIFPTTWNLLELNFFCPISASKTTNSHKWPSYWLFIPNNTILNTPTLNLNDFSIVFYLFLLFRKMQKARF